MAKDKKKFNIATSRTIYFPFFGCFILGSMLWDTIDGYVAGGDAAPTMAQFIVSVVLFGGGVIFTGIQTIRTYKAEYKKFEAQKAAEAAAAAEAIEEPEEA